MQDKQLVKLFVDALQTKKFLAAFLVGLLLVIGLAMQAGCPGPSSPGTSLPGAGDPGTSDPDLGPPPPPAGPGSYLFCFWNVENLFDDQDDGRKTRGDKEYDSWFSHDRPALTQKLSNLCDVLVPLNDGRGPDILCVAEIESERAAELLRQALNRRMGKPELAYRTLLHVGTRGGRHIGTAILTRLPAEKDRTRLLGSQKRILEGRLKVAEHPLVVVASHWTSRISDTDGGKRGGYGDTIYGRFKELYTANPQVDFLVCGDFNDNPDDPSVTEHLRAVGDEQAVRDAKDDPLLFNVFARLWRDGEGSHYYRTKPFLFDQVCVSPGMLDQEGWSCDVSSAQIVKQMATRQGRPNRFGGESDKLPLTARGASDHFPVTVRLRVR